MDKCYKNNLEYLNEQLELMDLILLRLVAIEQSKDNEDKEFSLFKDQVISDAEVESLFFNPEDHSEEVVDLLDEIITLTRKIKVKCKNTKEQGVPLYLEALCDVFNFSDLEKMIILLGMLNNLDKKYDRIIGFVHDNISKKTGTIGLVAKIQDIKLETLNDLKRIFDRESFLCRFILEDDETKEDGFYDRKIRTKDRIADFVLNASGMTNKLAFAKDFTNIELGYCDTAMTNSDIQKQIENIVDYSSKDILSETVIVNLRGQAGSGRKLQLKNYCQSKGKGLIVVDTESLVLNSQSLISDLNDIICEALLGGFFICFDQFEIFFKSDETQENRIYDEAYRTFLEIINIYPMPVFVIGEETRYELVSNGEIIYFDIDNPKPNFDERVMLWHYYMDKYQVRKRHVEDLAVKFTFTPGQIKSATWMIHNKEITDDELIEEAIYEIIHLQVKHKLKGSVVKVKPSYTWDDLILPKEQKQQFMDVCNRVKNANIVYEDWGFDKKIPYGRGVTIICSGPPGTGKSMSAQVLAKELKLELFRIDLSQVISKYIGETEKKLERIFEEAKTSNAILFFDEGDSLFGKRTTVKQANDRYANIETSYLLQKIEEYEGISIITTNLLENIDKAFLRRMQFIISFPFPDAEARIDIWKGLIPEAIPVSDEIDYVFLSETFEIAGGNIKNVVLYSAFIAAQENEPLNMRHILYAIRYELQKLDKLLLGEDLKEYRHIYAELLS